MMPKLSSFNESWGLTASQIQHFDDFGYIHLKNVWSDSDLEIIKSDMDAAVDGKFTVRIDLHSYESLKEAHTGKKMCDIADSICNARAIPIGSASFFCKPNNPLEFGSIWHQDNFAPMCPNGRNYINLALALDDADSTNGSLIVVPGSHKFGMLNFTPSPNFIKDEYGQLVQARPIGDASSLSEYTMQSGEKLPHDLEIKQLKYQKGDVLVIHGLLLHKADKNTHPEKWRRTIYFVYVKEKEPFWPGWNAKRSLIDRYDSALAQ